VSETRLRDSGLSNPFAPTVEPMGLGLARAACHATVVQLWKWEAAMALARFLRCAWHRCTLRAVGIPQLDDCEITSQRGPRRDPAEWRVSRDTHTLRGGRRGAGLPVCHATLSLTPDVGVPSSLVLVLVLVVDCAAVTPLDHRRAQISTTGEEERSLRVEPLFPDLRKSGNTSGCALLGWEGEAPPEPPPGTWSRLGGSLAQGSIRRLVPPTFPAAAIADAA